MRKIIIASGITFVLFIILFILAILNLNLFINSNKDYFIYRIEESLGRKIRVDEIYTGFSEGLGIRLKNFSLSDDSSFAGGEFIRASDVQINVEFLPLLGKKIVVSKFILNNPVITLIKNKEGNYNFSNLGSTKKSKNRKSEEKTNQPPLFVSSIVINKGLVNYIDEANESELQVQKINFRMRDLGSNNKIPLGLEAAVLSSEPNVKLKGVFGPLGSKPNFESIHADGMLEISDLNVSALKKFIPAISQYIPDGLDVSGPINAGLNFSGTPDSMILSNIDLKASLFGASVPNLELSGTIGPIGKSSADFKIDTGFSLKKANLSKLRNFSLLRESLPYSLSTQGTVDFNGRIIGNAKDLKFKSLKLDATASRLAIIGKFLKPKNTPFVISSSGSISDNLVEIKNLEILLGTLELNAGGRINRGTTNLMDLSLTSNQIDLEDLAATFPSLSIYNPAGRVQVLKTRLTGELGKGQVPDITGSITISDASVNPASFPKPITSINTKIDFHGKSAEIGDMSLNLGGSSVYIAAKINQYSPLELSYQIVSPELNIADISKQRQNPNQTEIFKQLNSQGNIYAGYGLSEINGELSAEEAEFSGFEMRNLSTRFNYKEKTLVIESFNGNAYDGEIAGRANYNLSGESGFSAIAGIMELDLKKFLNSQNPKSAEKIQGKANLDLNVFGSGSGWNEIKETLKGTAKVNIADGAVSDINIADRVLQKLTGVQGLAFFISRSTKKTYPQVFTSHDTNFDEFRSSFVIQKGKMETNDLRILSKDYLISGNGWIGLDSQVDLKSQLILSKELSHDLSTDMPDLKFILNSTNQVEIPFSLTGTLPDAKTRLDIAYLAKLIQQAGIREVINDLTSKPEERREKEMDTTSENTPAKKEKRINEKIYDSLKDLF